MIDNEWKFGQQVDAVVLKANRQLELIKGSFVWQEIFGSALHISGQADT